MLARGETPLVLSLPHTGTRIPEPYAERFVSPWLARKDTDWWVEQLYEAATALDITTLRTTISRSVIDVNRDPDGHSLYPDLATTELCPTTTFDGEPLYRGGLEPSADEIRERCARWFVPYHQTLVGEVRRLRRQHARVVLLDAHAIRSEIPRLFDGLLPHCSIGTHGGASCDPALTKAVESLCDASVFSRVTNGRFRGGQITRRYGQPVAGVHALQLELAFRGFLAEVPGPVFAGDWPVPFDAARARPMRALVSSILLAAIAFATTTHSAGADA